MNSKANAGIKLCIEKGYTVVDGLVYNKFEKAVPLITCKNGYKRFHIRDINNNRLSIYVHRFVAYRKIGDRLFRQGYMVVHKNGDKSINTEDNICVKKSREVQLNIPKKIRQNNATYAASFTKKYNNNEIIDFHKESKSYKTTMKEFGITSKATLHYILNPK